MRLLRSGRTIEQAFSPSFVPGEERALEERPWSPIDGARLFVGQIYTTTPPWMTFIGSGADDLPTDMFAGGAGAVIFVPVGQRVMAVCFGHAHIALNFDAFERQFGLKVTLNSVPRDKLRSLDLATPDAVTFQKRVQASKDSDIQAFGVDMLRDLARVAGGTPKSRSFARFVAGQDNLSMTCEVDEKTLAAKCAEALAAFGKATYRKEFAWVDNMRIVAEKDLLEQLDTLLFADLSKLRNGQDSELHLAPPEIVNYTEGCQLHYNGFGSHGTDFFSLSIEDYVAELVRCKFAGGIDEIKEKHRIAAKADASDDFTEKWRLYDCFVFEVSVHVGGVEKSYVLFAGNWYQVEQQFKQSVEAFFDRIEKVSIIGPTLCRNEVALIDEIDANRADLLKLDRQKINPGGVRYASLEPCDFFSQNKEFIHLKDGHSSGPISHLWFQGVVSAEAFVSDGEFRKKLRAMVRSLGRGFETHLPKSSESPKRHLYKVVYGIMRKPYADGTLGLPFFSKVSLQAAVERIEQFNIPVAIELIEKPSSDANDEVGEKAAA
tara:strand:+ start:10715 stop:12355 length:1641 start_codon:yes stop_codon:yes gene_type:complete